MTIVIFDTNGNNRPPCHRAVRNNDHLQLGDGLVRKRSEIRPTAITMKVQANLRRRPGASIAVTDTHVLGSLVRWLDDLSCILPETDRERPKLSAPGPAREGCQRGRLAIALRSL